MAKNARRKRHRILALIAAGAMALVVVLVVAIVVVVMRRPETPSAPPSAQPPAGVPAPPTTRKPRPEFQSADCPDVMMISIPGTWESSPTDDPFNPTQFPLSLMSNISRPMAEQFPPERLQVFTVPYTAQFHNPFSADKQMSYNDSRAEGTRATVKAMTDMNERCPLTSYVIAGFSQGAVIGGDVASDIGNGRGPVDQDLVLGVTLIADGRRQMGVGQDVGPNPVGQGAEITLHEVPTLSALGLSMTGPRPGGFGALNDRTFEICGAGDLICSAPEEAFSILNLPKTLETLSGSAAGPVHALYNTPQFWVENGQTATQWTLNWAKGLVENAPHPKHG
ncbi:MULTISPECIES: cutinase family protein [Mycolicibacterium]|uniref:Cutinase n=1 Tax=Mycolicibacterium wolinskyi TaxID=59750 RepID=A0A1X2FAA5_9MYCO|nr:MULTISPECIES: cutinase family protein [Mycolicibacterium]MCV7285413.1 cutinase family protein [Mycolicibacterium wolinskyi]MCV7295084.1 cutinase family protein [Mycolicibacterium goodii]ORX15381.1 cutinase [Mycolicibacterium wolinskyi]